MRVAAITLAGLVATAATAGAGPAFVHTWVAPDAQPGTLQGKKVMAVFVSEEEALRRNVEDVLARELTKRGAQGTPAYSIVSRSDIRDTEKTKAKLAQSGAAGIVAMWIVGREQAASGSVADNYGRGTSGVMSSGDWTFAWSGVYDPGTLRTDQVVSVETRVYSLEQGKLLWASTSQATNPKKVEGLVKDLVGKVAAEMKKAGLVKGESK